VTQIDQSHGALSLGDDNLASSVPADPQVHSLSARPIVGDQVIRGLSSTGSTWAKVDDALKRAGYVLPPTAISDD